MSLCLDQSEVMVLAHITSSQDHQRMPWIQACRRILKKTYGKTHLKRKGSKEAIE